MDYRKNGSLLLRIGIAFSFIYVGYASIVNPANWIGFIPNFVSGVMSKEIALVVHAVFDLLLGLWLLVGWRIRESALVSAGFLFLIVIFNLGAWDIVFRDVAILLAALGLVALNWRGN